MGQGYEDLIVKETTFTGSTKREKKKKKNIASGHGPQLYDVGDVDVDDGDEELEEAAAAEINLPGAALYDVGGDTSDKLVKPQVRLAPRPSGVVSELLAGVGRRRSSFGVDGMTTQQLGRRVRVNGLGDRRLVFVGPHHLDGEIYCGVELDDPIGASDGMFDVSGGFAMVISANYDYNAKKGKV